jgi:hypothetical protein
MKRSVLFVCFLIVVAGFIASMIFPDYMMWIMLPIILGIPIVFTIVNIVKGRPLLRKGRFGIPQINETIDLEEENPVPSMNLSARALEDSKKSS